MLALHAKLQRQQQHDDGPDGDGQPPSPMQRQARAEMRRQVVARLSEFEASQAETQARVLALAGRIAELRAEQPAS